MERSNENAIEWITGKNQITLTLSQQRFINKVLKMQEQYPDDIEVVRNKDGTIYATMPLKALHLTIYASRVPNNTAGFGSKIDSDDGDEKIID